VDTQIIQQLVWIKWLLIALGVEVGLFLVIAGALAVSFIRHIQNQTRHHSFQELAKKLLDLGKPEEVLALAELRAAEYPADAYAFWFIAHASYRLGNMDRALFSLKKTRELEPRWEDEHIAPLMRAIEEKLHSSKSPV
jgi:cytochrome c-type biogenesis protein CcmH/NrfG